MKQRSLKPSVEYIFKSFQKNTEMLKYLKEKPPELFKDLIEAALDLEHPRAWRSAMLVGHAMEKNDNRLLSYVDEIIECLPKLKHDGHQRQLLIILDNILLNEDQNGHLFNYCLTIWENVNKIPSTRIRSFQAMFKMTKHFPELKAELKLFTTDYYTKTLSEGIKVSFMKIADTL